MLNSMPRHSPEPPAPRARMTPDERRRQLLGIGLRKFVDRPVQELSLDEVAAEAGVSRGLLFHYFPTKTAYHQAVVAAAGRRFLRNARPDDGATGEVARIIAGKRVLRPGRGRDAKGASQCRNQSFHQAILILAWSLNRRSDSFKPRARLWRAPPYPPAICFQTSSPPR